MGIDALGQKPTQRIFKVQGGGVLPAASRPN